VSNKLLNMINLKDNELTEKIKGQEKTLVLFSAEWCGPCKVLKPNMESVEGELKESYNFIKADISENEENTKRFGIKNIPTCILIQDDKEISRFSGVKTSEQIKKFLEDSKN
jgi:thioredoxin 1